VAGAAFTTAWGRIGAKGQQKEKSFASPEAAQAAADKLVSEKLAEGYAEKTAA
jgi:predicted DNA-binding WGR domain protein